ncbi:MAG TPA: SMC-Scp complex subunit ScpB [Candidatus Borkfalkia excrementigallinarum]|uniref:SMC-Scp complex subunit ScpB n=1 Tax=Candidatus Borkfalkia excrementigallinarum TaxID=2838506 RepID=A0A9D2CSH6_9FIRM|nr:SMC-Scp complex subunit ScpB [Candidatus Borkfalkia excrementigallinarum]
MEILENLSNILESILFVSGNPVPVDIIAEKLGVSDKDVRDAAKKLQERYAEKGGLRLLTFNKKLQLSSNPEYKDYVSSVLNPIKEREFTRTILECSAIIAYKQPITKGELEALRGLNCDYAIHTLLDLKMIEPVGRKDAVGRPILYATTDNFLKRFKLNSIEDLPDYDTLMENIAKLHADEPDSYLYANNVYVDSQSQNEAVEDNGSGASDTGNLSGNTTSDADRDDLPDFLQDLDADDIIKIE